MKTKLFIFLFYLLNSCTDPGGDPLFEGFEVSFINNTNEVYDAEIVVGGYKNDIFMSTDSISLSNIKRGKNNGSYFIDKNRWKPNLDKIRNLPSEKCGFKIKLSNGREEFIIDSNTNEVKKLLLPEVGNFYGYFGFLIITINDSNFTGGAVEEF